jgi:hypothetical protein
MGVSCVPGDFTFTTAKGHKRTIWAIPEEDLPAYHLLGSGANVTFGLTFFEGILHCPDFTERVAGFQVRPSKHSAVLEETVGTPYISVDFYEKRV